MLTGGRAGSRRAADPAYTPDIGHLVHRSEARAKSARARLAEVLSLTRTATKLRQVAHRKAAERGGSERLQYAGMPATSRVLAAATMRLHQQNDRSSPLPSLHQSVDKGITGTAASRLRSEKSLDGSRDSPLPSLQQQQSVDQPAKGGGHVSVVHVRSTSEPWRQQPSRELSIGGSGDCSRELSPVRWCDQEVDGVFLGRSGWVQVQAPQQQHSQGLHPHRPTPGQFHSPRSEPLPSPQRPGYLPLPTSLDLGPVGTPPQTPIISPPPAFQDMKRSPRRTGLARSDAIAHESPPASPPPSRRPLRTLAAARSVEESRRAYRESTSSSVSSFEQAWFPGTGGMRSLDSQTAARAMPRLSETDSSMGYDESDYSTLTLINSPLMPQPQVNLVERVSPSRGRQRMRRSPGSEKNGPGSGSSSSSSSPSQHWRRVPVASTNQPTIPIQLGRAYADASRSYADNVRAYSENNRSYSTEVGRAGWTDRGYGAPAYTDPAKIYAESRLAQQQADKASRVRRSRSLQLPERRSPNPPNASPQPEYADSGRIVNGGKRPPLYNRNAQSEDLRREAEEEARVVTEFLQSARSREAARNLLRSRLGATSDFSPSQQPPMDAGYLAAAGRRARLTRMTTAPTGPPPCNPSSCDFWPHCAHRDGHYSSSRASTPVGPHQPTMRLSHSYPNQGKRESPKYGYSSRSSPASLERVDTSPRPRRGMSLNIPEQRYRRSPDRYEDITYKRESVPVTVHKAESYSEDWRHGGGRWAGDRPGSAPAAHIQQSARFAESAQRSLSLPKCFQAGREVPRPPRIGGQSYQNPPWSRRQSPSPGPMLRPPTPELSRTAPPTPVRELVDKDGGEPGRYSSTPLLEPQPKDWPLTGDWSQSDEVKCQDDVEYTNHISESVLQKFKKSFSLRLHKKEGEVSPPGTPKEEHEKFRLGPLVWRSSKERKKKAARNAKCNSGDSGIQIEMAGSSESTDQPPDTDESPPIVRRRGTASSSDSRPSRPSSEVLNQFLIDRLKAELSARRSPGVRRTHSDLGGQRLYQWELRRGYRRMISHPAPIRARPNRPALRGSRGHHRLRRSVSQPLGLNELSPVLVRKVQGIRTASEDERGPGTSEDEALSDSESSLASLSDRKRSLDRVSRKSRGILAEAVWDHVAMEAEELGFRAGDVVTVIDRQDRDWWWGESDGRAGWFPSLFVRLKVGQVTEEQTSSRKLSESEVRSRVVSELVATERDFVSVLNHLHDGYLLEARKRPDLLLDEEVDRIFSNLPQILEFQKSFLSDLEDSIDQNNTARSKISPVFLKHLPGFRLYSEYCNGHAAALATLEEVSRRSGVVRFWEACRLMRGLMELPLSGYLLTPVQRICKYPLQLAELLKYTKTDHEDYDELKEAVEGMRGVAFLINERKRRMESLEKVVLWQRRVDAWQGEDLIERSCQLLHQGEATQLKLSTSPGKWSHNVSLFLFDRQLIYCKRDILKRRSYVYKGRISLDACQIISLPDGKDTSLNCTIRHGLKLVSGDRWLLFTVRSEQEKDVWLSALDSERQAVEQEHDLLLPDSARELARAAASRRHHNLSSSKQRPKKRSKHREVGRWFRLGGRKHVFPS